MIPSPSSLRRLYALLRSESGVAVPTVLVIITIGLGMAGAAAVAAIDAQRGSVRDEDSKQGIAAADAGALRALFHQNKLKTTQEAPCVVASGGQLTQATVESDGWCPQHTGTVGGAGYSYRVSAPVDQPPVPGEPARSEVTIVSVGTSDEVSRRIAATSTKLTGAGLLSGASVMGLDGVTLDSNAEVNGNVASNGDIVMSSNSLLCGNAQYGVGHSLLISGNAEQCDEYSQAEGELTLPMVDQGDVPTNNSNGRFFTEDIKQGNDVTWNATTRTLTLDSNSALTLGGTVPYSFCKLELKSNSTLYIAEGAQVRIFFDAPENCIDPSDGQPYSESDEPVRQFVMSSNTKITNTSGDPTTAAFLMVGSETISTIAELNSNSHVNIDLILYAPFTDIELDSNSTFRGAIAGQSVHLDSNAEIQADNRVSDFVIPIRTVYEAARYVECSVANPGPTPDSGC
jgi:hypothetical protein